MKHKTKPLRSDHRPLFMRAIEALEGLRCCAQDLRPRILDDLGLVPALEWMAETGMRNFAIDAHVEILGNERNLSNEMQVLLFRIAQEALSNIRRHSEASKATVKLEFENGNVKMTITDNGKGFELPGNFGDLARVGKLGLAGMEERARLLGGWIRIESKPGEGTSVVVEAPI